MFILMPLEHSEDLEDQKECVGHFAGLLTEAKAMKLA